MKWNMEYGIWNMKRMPESELKRGYMNMVEAVVVRK